MRTQDLKELQAMLDRYGVYVVAKMLASISEHESQIFYDNNPGAIIHKDVQALQKAVEEMKNSHPLRRLQA